MHRAVAPVIATLLLITIAVVGGSIIFVFSQTLFSSQQINPDERELMLIPSTFPLDYVAHGVEFNEKEDKMYVYTMNQYNVEIKIEYFCDIVGDVNSCWENSCSKWTQWVLKDKLECEQREKIIHNQERMISLLETQQ